MIYCIVGGTGTLGRELTKKLIKKYPECKIRIVSRCELKQQKMRHDFQSKNITYHLGDITRPETLDVINGCNVVFHVAALKHVDVLEDNPEQALFTNSIGTLNLANKCIQYQVEKMVFFTTDKAVDPINAYGFSKAIAERMLLSKNESQNTTDFILYRWGNILGSSGSIFEKIEQNIAKNERIRITDSRMTRFWLLIEDAVNFVLDTYLQADKNLIHVPENLKSANLVDIISAYLEFKGMLDTPIYKMPIRKGEKLHENMYSDHGELRPWYTSKDCPKFSKKELKEIIERWHQQKPC